MKDLIEFYCGNCRPKCFKSLTQIRDLSQDTAASVELILNIHF